MDKMIGLVVLALAAGAVQAQQAQDFGDYVVHYNAINASLIPPDVARSYGIQRSTSRALLNITVLRKVLDNPGTPVKGQVTASAQNLTGQRREIALREVDDNGAIYYLGDFRVHNEESFDFTVHVTPDGESEPLVVRFRQTFYTE